MSFAPKDTEEAWFESLRTEVRDELSQFDGAAFGSAVMSALDAEVENAELVLRSGEATAKEISDAQFVDGNAEMQSVLRRETEQELAELEPEFSDFGAEVFARIDPAVEIPAVQAALRAETAQELAAVDFAGFGAEVIARAEPRELSEELQAALRNETAQELDALQPEFADFGAEVMARMEPVELSAEVQAALRTESAQEIAQLESEWPDFVEEVMVRIDPVPENVTVQAMLQQEVGAELKRRDGEWNAFTARVFDAIDSEQRATARLPLEEQAVHQLREEVDGELHQMAPQFEEQFGEEVERKIFKSAQSNPASEPGLWQRFTDFVRDLSTPTNYGWAAAMGAAAVLLVVTNIPTGTQNVIDPPMEALQGYVSVQDMSFEGSAIVIPDEGMTIVLLSDES